MIEHSPTLAIHARARALREAGRPLVHFGFGQSPFPPPKPVVRALREHAEDSRYLPSQGLGELRRSAASYLSRRFGCDADAERVLVGPGSKELIFGLLLAHDGDLILPAPSWVSYAPQARLLGKRVVWARCDPAGGYRMSPDDLQAACRRSRSRTKLLILNSPCNPTGAVYREDELAGISAAARRHNVTIISDEIYAEIVFGRKSPSISTLCPERVIVTTGLSKGFSSGGYRLGIACLPRKCGPLMERLVGVASETFSCVCAPVQHAAVAAFGRDRDVRRYVRDTTALHKMAGRYLWQGVRKIGLRCPEPEGAFYLFPDFSAFSRELRKAGIGSDAALCERLLEERDVAMLPGVAFGVRGSDLAVRIATVDYDGAAALRAFRRRRPRTEAQKRAFVERHCPSLAEGVRRIKAFLEGL